MQIDYVYKAKVIKVVDGDTLIVDIDLGCYTHITKRLRLDKVNAPEQKTAEGKAATAWVKDNLPKDIIVRTIKDKNDKYGRLLGVVYVGQVNFNDELVKAGRAVGYK
jgi:micrococcal nuclease